MKSSRFLFTLLLLSGISFRIFSGVMVMNGLTHIHKGVSGNTISGVIVLKNEGDKENRVLVYQQDMSLSCSKALEYLKIGSHSRSVGNWLKTNVDEKTLQPNEEYEVSYTINVPSNVTDIGSYWGVIMVEVAAPLKEETSEGFKIESRVRYAIQILLDVGTFQSSKMIFEKIDLSKSEVQSIKGDSVVNVPKVIHVKLRNEGIFLERVKLNLEIFDSNGEKIKVIDGLRKKVFPSYCNDFEIELKDLAKGKYEGVLVADNGKDLFGENLTIEIE